MDLLQILSLLFSVGGLGLLVVTIGLYVDYYFYQSAYFVRYVQKFVWLLIIFTTVGSTALSLVYSEYFGFIPCSLCWLQRMALYPQALLSIMAFRIKETVFFPLYGIALSVFGLGVALYHYLYQMLPKDVITSGVMPCLADGSANCATKVIDEFGFVTFPLLSAITFAFLIILYLNQRRSQM